MKGYVYVLSNKSLHSIYKIGMTARTPEERAAQLSTTGLPTNFIVEYYIHVENYDNIEKLVHKRLARYNTGKEFLNVV